MFRTLHHVFKLKRVLDVQEMYRRHLCFDYIWSINIKRYTLQGVILLSSNEATLFSVRDISC